MDGGEKLTAERGEFGPAARSARRWPPHASPSSPRASISPIGLSTRSRARSTARRAPSPPSTSAASSRKKDVAELNRRDHARSPAGGAGGIHGPLGPVRKDLLPELNPAIRFLLDGGLAVIADPHATYGNFRTMSQNPDLADLYARWLGLFAKHLAETSDPECVFMDLMNEPASEGYYGAKWSDYQDRLIMAVSAAAPHLTMVANAGGWLMVQDTVQHDPHPYRNMVFAVHYYEPGAFTHQGAVDGPLVLAVAGRPLAVGRVESPGGRRRRGGSRPEPGQCQGCSGVAPLPGKRRARQPPTWRDSSTRWRSGRRRRTATF